MSYDAEKLRRDLVRDEGKRLSPYRDSLGNWTVGVGHLLIGNELMQYVDVPTTRIKRNMTEEECADTLVRDIVAAEKNLGRILPGWKQLDETRQRALLNLSFNLGGRLARFHGFLQCVEHQQWDDAAYHLQTSLWWKQVKSRGPRIAYMIQTGSDPENGDE